MPQNEGNQVSQWFVLNFHILFQTGPAPGCLQVGIYSTDTEGPATLVAAQRAWEGLTLISGDKPRRKPEHQDKLLLLDLLCKT